MRGHNNTKTIQPEYNKLKYENKHYIYLNDQFVAGGRALQLDEVVVGAVCGEKRARVLEVFELGVTLQRTHRGCVVPVGEKHPAIGRGEPVLLPLGQVVIVIQPLIHQLAEVDLDVPPEPSVNGLHLVRKWDWV